MAAWLNRSPASLCWLPYAAHLYVIYHYTFTAHLTDMLLETERRVELGDNARMSKYEAALGTPSNASDQLTLVCDFNKINDR